jgi:hypothetical protein
MFFNQLILQCWGSNFVVSGMLGKYSTTELHPQPSLQITAQGLVVLKQMEEKRRLEVEPSGTLFDIPNSMKRTECGEAASCDCKIMGFRV